jgi:23S rRNA (adenine2503-C2)-methyltransferase
VHDLIGMELSDIRDALAPKSSLFHARRIFDSVYAERSFDPQLIPEPFRHKFRLGSLTEAARYESSDGTVRYLMQLADGKTVETVFMTEGSRDTICVSSQVGCPVDCKFCLTALMGLERNLTAGEIVGQVLHVMQQHNLAPKSRTMNIVMMGQGEPLMNLDNVLKATRILVDQRGIGMGERRICLSTSGLIPKIDELALASVRPRLAISLNASSEEQRQQIMPITKKWHLADLLEACRRFPLKPKEHIFFEYVLLGGVNDSLEDAQRVVELLQGLTCKVNLIPLNPGPGIPFETPTDERVEAFQRTIMRSFHCYVRKPRGRDIYAACGQLNRMNQSNDLLTIASAPC